MKALNLRRTVVTLFLLPIASQNVSAATASGSGALALASVVAAHSPLLSEHEKSAMARLLGGQSNIAFRANKKIFVKADRIGCRYSNLNITSRSCELTFGATSVKLTGRDAHELYATIAEAGVPDEHGMGSTAAVLEHLVCTIELSAIAQQTGDGAECTFDHSAAPDAG
jgi:hypothetical protein